MPSQAKSSQLRLNNKDFSSQDSMLNVQHIGEKAKKLTRNINRMHQQIDPPKTEHLNMLRRSVLYGSSITEATASSHEIDKKRGGDLRSTKEKCRTLHDLPNSGRKKRKRNDTLTEHVGVTPPQQGCISDLRSTDVLMGRGSGVAAHSGNKRFREIIQQYKAAYTSAPRNQKMPIAASVVGLIEEASPPGRFVERDTHGRIVVVCEKRALEKTSQALRERPSALSISDSPTPSDTTDEDGCSVEISSPKSTDSDSSHIVKFAHLNKLQETESGVFSPYTCFQTSIETKEQLDISSNSSTNAGMHQVTSTDALVSPTVSQFTEDLHNPQNNPTVRFPHFISIGRDREHVISDDSTLVDRQEQFDDAPNDSVGVSFDIFFDCIRRSYI